MAILVVVADDGIIDDYIFYLADNIKQLVKKIVITVNGKLDLQYQNRLSLYCDSIFIRENKGFDSAAFKETLETFVGWNKVAQYKELILINDSCYGPIYPLIEMFHVMDKMQYDFWGVTEQTPIKRSNYGTELYPYHIQTYFVVVEEDMLHSKAFQEFWENIQLPKNYSEAVENFELKFTSYFNSLGYLSGAYIDCENFCKSVDETQAYVFMDSFRLVSEYRCPLLKKKVFSFPHEIVMSSNLGETASKTLTYIKENTEYDSDLIWQYLIRKCNLNDIRTSLHLDFCLSAEQKTERKQPNKALLVVIYVESYLEDKYISYIKNLPEYVDVVICVDQGTSLVDIKNMTAEEGIVVKEYLYLTDKNTLEFSGFNRYEYLCVLNNSRRNEPNLELIWENLVSNEIYMQNIIGLFEKEKKLGFLSPPNYNVNNHSDAMLEKTFGLYIKQFLEDMKLNCNADESKLPFSYGNAFWCRTKALRPLLEEENWIGYVKKVLSNKMDLVEGILEKTYPYIAQSQGYYSGVVMTKECASRFTCDYFYLLSRSIYDLCVDKGIQEFKNIRSVNSKLQEFCNQFKGIYIYGGGEIGYSCLLYLQAKNIEVKGFIISYGITDDDFAGKKVNTLSEVEIEPDVGVVIALTKMHVKDVERLLKEKGNIKYISYER